MCRVILIGAGALARCLADRPSAGMRVKQFGFSWLLAFMFCLSLCLGGWFLVMVHHMFDASWSVPIRRVTEAELPVVYALAVAFPSPGLARAQNLSVVAGPEQFIPITLYLQISTLYNPGLLHGGD